MRTKIERLALKHVLSRLPDKALVLLSGGKPVRFRDRTLNPLLQAMMFANRARPGMETLSVAQARRAMAKITAVTEPDLLRMDDVREVRIPVDGGTVRARCYVPPGIGLPSAGVVFLHGGGHVVGDLDSYDRTVRYIATQLRARVVSVDYRRAPEHRFPAAALDCIAAWRWVLEHAAKIGIDPARIGVMGDSAGGNLAAVVAMAARDQGFSAPKVQCLVYPVVDLRLVSPSIHDLGEGFGLTEKLIRWFENHYVGTDPAKANALGSPLLAESHRGLAPAIVTVAGFDPLHDEGVEYAGRLRAAGVPVTLLRHNDLTHAWLTMAGVVPPARAALDETCAALSRVLAS